MLPASGIEDGSSLEEDMFEEEAGSSDISSGTRPSDYDSEASLVSQDM